MTDLPTGIPGTNVLVFRTPSGEAIVVPSEVATAAERAYRCYQLQLGGTSWTEIAEQEKYPSPGAAKADVDRYMLEARSLVVESSMREVMTLQYARLDMLLSSVWSNARTGHIPSVREARGLIMDQAKLVGLDPERMGDEANKQRTVVIPATDDGFLAGLKRAAEASAPTIITPPQGEPDADT